MNEKEDDNFENHKAYVKNLMGNAFIISLLSNGLFVVIGLVFGPVIFKKLLSDISFYPYIFFSILSIFFVQIKELFSYYLIAQQKGRASFNLTMIYFTLLICLNFVFVVGMGMDAIGILISPLIVGGLFSIYVTYVFLRDLNFTLNTVLIKRMLSYSLPLIVFIYLGYLIEHTDRLALNTALGKEASGIYYIAFTFAGIFSTLKESMYQSISPWYFKNWDSQSDFIVKIMTFLIGFAAIVCFGVSAFSYEILIVLSSNPELIQAWKFVPILSFGYYLVFLNQMFVLPIFHMKNKTYLSIMANFGGFITITAIAIPAIRHYQTYGAVTAKLGAFFVMFLIMAITSLWKTKTRYELLPITIISLVLGVACLVQYLSLPYWHLLFLKAGMAVFFTLILLLSFKYRFRYHYDLSYTGMKKRVEQFLKRKAI